MCVRETGVSVDVKRNVHDSNTTDHTLFHIYSVYLLLVQEETTVQSMRVPPCLRTRIVLLSSLYCNKRDFKS